MKFLMIPYFKTKSNEFNGRLLNLISGSYELFSLENRIFNIISFTTTGIVLIICVFDMMIPVKGYTRAVAWSCFAGFTAIYISSRRTGLNASNTWGYILLICLCIFIEWYFLSGFFGYPLIFGMFLACVTPMFLSGKNLHAAFIFLGCLLSVIFILELTLLDSNVTTIFTTRDAIHRFFVIFALSFGLSWMIFQVMEENRAFRKKINKSEKEILFINERLAAQNKQLKDLATTDQLTGIYNRHALYEYMQEQWSRAVRNQEECSLVIFDIDYFKAVNDTYGHIAGDQVLRIVAQKVKSMNRSYDHLGRWGGEEYLLFLPATNLNQGQHIADRLRKAVSEIRLQTDDNQSISVTASFGVTSRTLSNTIDLNALIEHADKALYRAKENGRNQVVVYQNEGKYNYEN